MSLTVAQIKEFSQGGGELYRGSVESEQGQGETGGATGKVRPFIAKFDFDWVD